MYVHYNAYNIDTYNLVFIRNGSGIILHKRNVFISVRKAVDCGKKFTQNEKEDNGSPWRQAFKRTN